MSSATSPRRLRTDRISLSLLAATVVVFAVDAWVLAVVPYAAPLSAVIREWTYALVWTAVGVAAMWLGSALLAHRILGVCLVLAGTLTALLELQGDSPALRLFVTVVAFLVPLQISFGGHVLVSYPGGRVVEPFARRVVVIGYVIGAVQGVWWAFGHVSEQACDGCAQPFTLFALPQSTNDILAAVFATAWVLMSVFLVTLLARRYRRAGQRERRLLRLPYLTSAIAAVFYGGLSIVAGLQGVGDVWALSTTTLVVAQIVFVLGVPVSFLVGLLRERLSYRRIGDLVVQLASGADADLERSLATALGDPDLAVAFPVPGGYVDTRGRAIEPVTADERATVTAVGDPDAPLALIRHDRSLDDEPALLTAAGSATRLMLENARLQAEVRAQLIEVRESRARIVTAADTARAQLERDLHDGAQQRLLAVGLALRLLREQSDEAGLLDAAETELSSALAELRELAAGIHPAVLTDLGLVAALEALTARLGARVHLAVATPIPRCAPTVEAAAYFGTSEAVANALKHASPSPVFVRVAGDGGRIVISVRDEGPGTADPTGSGLLGIRDRLASVDGTLKIDSRIGEGTELTLEVPCA